MGITRKRLGWLFLFLLALGAAEVFVLARRHPVQIYYPETNALFLVPVTRFVNHVTPEALLTEIRKPPKSSSLLPSLPNADLVERVWMEGNTVIVNFRANPPVKSWPLLSKALLATFSGLSNAQTVEFRVGGNPNPVVDGLELNHEKLSTFRVNGCEGEVATGCESFGKSQTATLYFLLKGTDLLVPISLPVSARISEEAGIAERVSGSPPFPWVLSSPLPPGSRVLAVSRPSPDRIKLVLDLTGSRREIKLARKALRLTFAGIPSIRFVTLKEKGKFWTGLCPFHRPQVINREEKT